MDIGMSPVSRLPLYPQNPDLIRSSFRNP
jgi:hypothetical protein